MYTVAMMRRMLLALVRVPRAVFQLNSTRVIKKLSKYFKHWESKTKRKVNSYVKLKKAVKNRVHTLKKVY